MTIKTQDENIMEIIDKMPKGETILPNLIMGVAAFVIIYNVINAPSQYLYGILYLVIFGGIWFSYMSFRSKNMALTINKQSNQLTVNTTYAIGRKNTKEYPLSTIRSISATKKQLFYAFGSFRGQLPTMYFEFEQTSGNNIKIWIERKQLGSSLSNYLSGEEEKIPEKIAKFLNIPIS